jgi:hypothetical protein
VDQVPETVLDRAEALGFASVLMEWIADNRGHDVRVCDCCGDGDEWYSEPGSHDHAQFGDDGPYAYNGGLPECY